MRIPEEGERDPGIVFAMARNDFHRASSAGHYTGTMNLPREGSSAGHECVPAEIEGGYAPPIRTTFGLPAARAQLRDRGEHRPQVLNAPKQRA